MKNAGTLDRFIRVALGIALLTLALVAGAPLGYLGVVPLLTGVIGYCPLYRLLGLSTCPAPRR
jgi:hypothetical protein